MPDDPGSMSEDSAISATGPLIDDVRVSQLRRDPNAWGEIVALYRTYTSDLVGALEAALAIRDQRAVVRNVHQLKGCSANLGLLAVVATCERLEHALAEAGVTTVEDAVVPQLRSLIELSLARLP